MGDGDALLAAVLRHPDEDTPRLVFADWLDEHGGDPGWAALIRLQVAAEEAIRVTGPLGKIDPARAAPATLEAVAAVFEADRLTRPLLAAHGDRLATPLAAEQVAFRRGFVDAVCCLAHEWLEHADALLARHPVRAVVLRSWPSGGEVDGAFYRLAAECPRHDPLLAFARNDPPKTTVRNCRRVAPPADVMPAGRHACTRWLLEREWPGVAFTLPPEPWFPTARQWVAQNGNW